ncbi:hypothetical protein Tco_1377584 [Tanacetum coccineum]
MNTTSRESFSKTDERIDKLADQLSTLVEIVSKKVVTPAPVKAVEEICVTCSWPHDWYNCPNIDNNQASVCAATGTYNQFNPPNRVSNQMAPPGFAPVQNNGQNRYNQNKGQGNNFNRGASTLGTLSSNTIPNPKGEMKAITTRSGVAYEGPSILTNPSPKKIMERETEETTDKEQSNFQGSIAHIPPPVDPIPILGPDVPKTLPKPNIPYPSRHTSDSLLEEFADELAFLDPFPPGNEDVDVEAELREIELLFNRDPSTNFSPRITFDPNPERFTNEPSLVCLPPPGDECECNVPDSQTINFLTFSNPLFDDSASSNDESSHEEVTHEMSFITYSNPLFDLDEEIISSEFNPIHNKVLDSIPKNDHFDAKSYLPESPLNHNTLTVLSPRNDPLHHEFAGEIITNPSRIAREHEEYISRMWLLCGNSSSWSPENFHASPNTIIESLPIFPIPVQDSDSHREEIDIFPGPDDLIPPEIERDDYDSEDDENSTVDEPVLLHTPFPDEDECFDPGGDNDEINAFLAIEVPTYIEEGYCNILYFQVIYDVIHFAKKIFSYAFTFNFNS